MKKLDIQEVVTNYFDFLPFKVAIMDTQQNIVAVNKRFEQIYGNNWKHSKCYEFCKNSKVPCLRCQIQKVVQTGTIEIVQDSSVDVTGKLLFDVVIFSPIYNGNGEIAYVQEISIPQKDVHHWENDFNVLFENSPNFISIVDKEFNILRANRRMINTFGNLRGKKCYEVFKKKKQICNNCPTMEVFNDGIVHSSSQVGFTSTGEKTYFIMTSAPLNFDENGKPTKVMEIGIDITEINKLQEQLNFIHDFYGNLIEKSSEGIVAIDKKGKLQIFNSAAEKLLGWESRRKPGIAQARKFLPDKFFEELSSGETSIEYVKTDIKNLNDDQIPVHLKIFDIKDKNDVMGRVAIMNDLRPILEVEENKQRAKEIAFREKFTALGKDTVSILKELKQYLGEISDVIAHHTDYEFQRRWNNFYDRSNEHLQLMSIFVKYAQGYFAKPQLIELNELIENEFLKYRNLFGNSDLKLELNLTKENPVISCDIDSLKEAIFVTIIHYITYIQMHCAKITFRSFFNNTDIHFELEVKCNQSDIPDFSDGLSLSIIKMISDANNIEIKTLKLKEENQLKISFIFK